MIIHLNLYRVMKKSLCTWRLYCKHQVHREFLITLYLKYKYCSMNCFRNWVQMVSI